MVKKSKSTRESKPPQRKHYVTSYLSDDGFSITLTQLYDPEYNWGHYNFAIRHLRSGHIFYASNSSGGIPRGTAEELAKEEMRRFRSSFKERCELSCLP